MKQLLVFCGIFAAFLLTSCSPRTAGLERTDSRAIVKQIRSMKIQEASTARTVIVNAHFDAKKKGPYFQNIQLASLPMARSGSEIVITDTVGIHPDDTEVEIVPSIGGVNVIIDANIQEGDYYCQSNINGKMTCERGEIGVHLLKSNLTTLHTYTASDHFASAAARDKIIIFQRNINGTVSNIQEYSTAGTTICVYHENTSLVVASRP